MTDIRDPRMVFFDFLEFLVKDDIVFLQSYEDSLNELEEDLLAGKNSGRFLNARDFAGKEGTGSVWAPIMSSFQIWVRHLAEAADRGWDHAELLFGLYDERGSGDCLIWYRCSKSIPIAEGLSSDQNQFPRQNEIMQFLTIVTTIFMPLTL